MSEVKLRAAPNRLACPNCGRDERVTRLWMQKAAIPLAATILPAIPLLLLIEADLLGLFLRREQFEWFVLGRLAVMIFVLFKLPAFVRGLYRSGVTRTQLCRDCGHAFVIEPVTERDRKRFKPSVRWTKLLELVEEFNGNRRGRGRRRMSPGGGREGGR